MTGTIPGPTMGPCSAWISATDIADVCADWDTGDPVQLARLERASVDATQILWEKSGRQFTGLCGAVTVRPVRADGCGHWGGDFFYGGYTWAWLDAMGSWAWSNEQGNILNGCGYLSRVKLAGYAVREILEVKIDGSVLPTTYDDGSPQYRLDQWRFLTRMDDPAQPNLVKHWPACQNLALQDDQPGTFSVTYTYGVDPPTLGADAAAQLGCQIALAMAGRPCALPVGASRITRNGVTIDRGVLAVWGRDPKTGAWATGLELVDAFLNTYNPQGLRRRPAVLSPDIQQYAPKLGEQGN